MEKEVVSNVVSKNLQWLNEHEFYRRKLSDVDIFVQGKVISFDKLSPYFIIDYKNKRLLNFGMGAFVHWYKYAENIKELAKEEYGIKIEKVTSISWNYAIIHYEEELLKIHAKEKQKAI